MVHNTRKIGEVWTKRDTILEQVQFWSLVYGASVYFLTERNSSLAFLRGGNGHDCFDWLFNSTYFWAFSCMFFFSWLDAAYYQQAHSTPLRVHRLGFNFRVILMGDSAMGSHWASHSACEIGFFGSGKSCVVYGWIGGRRKLPQVHTKLWDTEAVEWGESLWFDKQLVPTFAAPPRAWTWDGA